MRPFFRFATAGCLVAFAGLMCWFTGEFQYRLQTETCRQVDRNLAEMSPIYSCVQCDTTNGNSGVAVCSLCSRFNHSSNKRDAYSRAILSTTHVITDEYWILRNVQVLRTTLFYAVTALAYDPSQMLVAVQMGQSFFFAIWGLKVLLSNCPCRRYPKTFKSADECIVRTRLPASFSQLLQPMYEKDEFNLKRIAVTEFISASQADSDNLKVD
jgi:hypothetical protein